MNYVTDVDTIWVNTLEKILVSSNTVAPRGQITLEIPQHTVCVNTRQCVLLNPARKLSYQFMAAEAYWILSGDNTVAGIAPFNKNIAEFSDDGETFFGAYGPRIASQIDYVVQKLLSDRDTRQAGLTIWRENPHPSKDIPCTVAIWFQIRRARSKELSLNCHVFMRSSDVWLGLPYDVFNFSMLTHLVAARFNSELLPGGEQVIPGHLYVTAASSHIYQKNFDAAASIVNLAGLAGNNMGVRTTPPAFFGPSGEELLMENLAALRNKEELTSPRAWWRV